MVDLCIDLIIRNTSKETVTSSLLHRVFGIGLRTLGRVRDFLIESSKRNDQPEIRTYTARCCVDVAYGVES